MQVPKDVQNAHKMALSARKRAHAPYSGFSVGAAIKLNGVTEAVSGCNIENASYGGTVCAERVALFSAVAQHGKVTPEFVVVVTAEKNATVPCALCLQALAEFCGDDFQVYLGNETEIQRLYSFRELLPHPFRSFQKDNKK